MSDDPEWLRASPRSGIGDPLTRGPEQQLFLDRTIEPPTEEELMLVGRQVRRLGRSAEDVADLSLVLGLTT